MQKLFLITGFISFLAPPPSSTSTNVLEAEPSPNQFQVFRETQRLSSAPGPEPESKTTSCVPQLTFLALLLRIVQIPHLKDGANGKEIFE